MRLKVIFSNTANVTNSYNRVPILGNGLMHRLQYFATSHTRLINDSLSDRQTARALIKEDN